MRKLKTLSLLLVVVLISLSLSACGALRGQPSALKVALLVKGDINEQSCAWQMNQGLERAKQELGIVPTVINAQDSVDSIEKIMADASKGGYDLIVLGGMDFADAAEQIIPAHPKQKYVTLDFSTRESCKNVYGLVYREAEGAFLAGALAAQLSQSQIIGFVGGSDNENVRYSQQGYLQGAQMMQPDIMLISDYVGDVTQVDTAELLALNQYTGGADVIYQAAGLAGNGVLSASAEAGKWVIGSDFDQRALLQSQGDPAAERVLTSVLKRLDVSLFEAIETQVMGKGLPFGTTESQGLAEGILGLADFQPNVSEETKAKMAELQEKIIAGEIVVTTE